MENSLAAIVVEGDSMSYSRIGKRDERKCVTCGLVKRTSQNSHYVFANGDRFRCGYMRVVRE